jgi:hypothetical protein
VASAVAAKPEESLLTAPAGAASARLRWTLRLTALLAAGVQAYASRHYLNADGVSYLDLADGWARGDWQAGLSSYWGPLYPAILGGALAIFHPAPYWEIAVVKLTGFGLFAGTLAAFEWLLHEMLLWRRGTAEGEAGLPERTVVLFAYPLFLVATLHLVTLELASPDLCVALLVYLAAALLTRNRRLGVSAGRAALLGLVLGLAYLAKMAMLPLGAVFLAASCFAAISWKKLTMHVAVAGTLWASIAGVYVGAMSAKAGRLTLGDASKLNYLWFVNGVEVFRWRTGDPGLGTPIHPPRLILEKPPVYEFGGPVAGTYPLWFDPAAWCAGLTPRWTVAEQLTVLGTTSKALLRILAVEFGVGAAVLLLLVLLARGGSCVAGASGSRQWAYHLVLPALVALGLYLMVHVQPRYVAPFLVLLALAVLVGLRFPSPSSEANAHRLRLLLAFAWIPVVVGAVVFGVRALPVAWHGEGPSTHPDWAVAQALARRGVGPGRRVAVLGDGFECGWARLGRLQIVAQLEARDVPLYEEASSAAKQAVESAFRRAGAVAVVAPAAPELGAGWDPVDGTDFRLLLLR